MADIKLTGELSMDTSKGEAAVEKFGKSAKSMAKEVEQSSTKAGDSVSKIGDGATESAAKFTRAEREVVAAANRMNQRLQLLGKTAAERLELKIDAKGLDRAKFEPLIQGLRDTEAQARKTQTVATGAIDKIGVSAGQTQQALRQLPAQFSDIIVSLQSGQAPLTVFLQQGAQIKDSFGGAGAAARALGGYVVGLINPFTAAAAVAGVLALAYHQGSQEADQYAKAIALTGNAAGVTTTQLSGMAANVGKVAGTQSQAAAALASLVGSGAVASGSLERFTATAVLMERNVGVAVKDTVAAFVELAKAPVEASVKLNQQHNYLTKAIYDQIKALEEQGRTMDAAAVAQQAYDSAMNKVQATMVQRLGYIESAWKGVKNAASEAWDAMLNVGRPTSNASVMQKLSADLDAAMEERRFARGDTQTSSLDTRIKKLKESIGLLQSDERQTRRIAAAEAERAALNKAYIEFDKQGDQFKDKAAKRDEEIAKAKVEGQALIAAGLITEVQLRERITDITKKYAEKKGGSGSAGVGENEVAEIRALIKAREQEIESLRKYGADAEKMTDGDRRVLKIKEELTTSIKGVARQRKEEALVAAEVLALRDREKLGEEIRIKGLERSKQAYAGVIDEARKTAAAIGQQADELAASNSMWGKGAVAVEKYRLALINARLAEIENTSEGSYDPAYVAGVREQAAQQQRKVDETRIADFKVINEQADELLRSAEAMATLYQDEAALSGKTSLERAKIVAQRQVELKYAKEIDKVNKSALNDDEKQIARDKLEQAKRIEGEAAVSKAIQDDWTKTTDQINQSLTDALLRGFESGKGFAENLRDTLKNMFSTLVLRPIISAVLSPVSGAINGLVSGVTGGAAGGGNNLMGMASNAYSLYNGASSAYTLGSQYLGGTMSGANALGSMYANATGAGLDGLLATNAAFGTSAQSAIAANLAMEAGTAPALAAGTNAAGGAAAGSWGAGGIAALIMLAVINALGGMRSETMIGSGLAGTLGGANPLTPWQEWREGGTLFDGPSFATHNPLEELSQRKAELQRLRDTGQGESNYAVGIQAVVTDLEKTTKGLAEQTEVFTREIGKGYKAYRSNVMDMADSLGLAGDSIKDFAYTLGAQDLNLQGLNPEQIQAKIAETFGKAGTDMAQQLLGSWKEVTDTVVNTYVTEQMTQASDGAFVTDTTVTKRMEYQASVYAKTGETAIQTLTRLATSFNTLNEASDALGFGIHQGSLALADFADDFIEAFGGLEKFASTTNAYMQNFYSDDERKQGLLRAGARQANRLLGEKDKVTAESLEALGRDGFRAFVDGLVAGGGSPEEIRDAMDLGNMIAPAFASVEAQTPVVQELSNVVDELTQSYQNAIKSLTGDRDSLAVEVLRAQGDEAGAKALERTQYLAQFAGLDEIRLKEISTLYDLNQATREHVSVLKERNSLQDEINALTDTSAQALARQRDALDESNRALFDKLQATKLQQTIAQELPGVLDKFRTPGQRLEAGYSGISEGLAKAGVQISPADLAAASLPQILAAATELYNLGTTSDDTRLALIRAASGLADLKAQAVDMATSVTDAAYAALEREVGVRREVVQETIDDVRTVFDAVSSAAKSLYGDVGSTAKMLAGQGRSFIAEALSTAQLTGYLPDGKELQEAITAATSGIGKQVYATQLDADRERLILAGQLSALGDISGDQLTEQEKQLKALDGILEANREQIDAIRGIDVRVLGVDARIAMLTEAVLKEASVRGVTVPGATAPGATQPTGIYQGKLGARYDANTDTGYQSITGLPWSGASVRDAAKAMMEAGNARGLYDLAVKEGFSLATMDKILQIGDGTAEDWARAMKLPIFHEGTNFVPRTGVALLQQGEAVIPAAFNPFAGGSGVGNTALVAAVDRLTAQNAELLARLTQIEKHSKRTAAATNGSPDQPVPNYITNEKLVTV